MTAILNPTPPSDLEDGSGHAEQSAFALNDARAVVRDGVLMVFGPDDDPLPPAEVWRLAAEQPDGALAYERGGSVSLASLTRVLEAQSQGPLAPGASANEALAWIEAMLGLGDHPEELGPEAPDQEPGGAALDGLATREAFELAALEPQEVEHWSPERPEFAVEAAQQIAPFAKDPPLVSPFEEDLSSEAGTDPEGERSLRPAADAGAASESEDWSPANLSAGPLEVVEQDEASPEEEPAATLPDIEPGALGLPEELELGREGVLGLECLAEAAKRVAGPILYARISGVPEGALLTAGRHDGDGNWSLTESDLARVSLVACTTLEDFCLALLLTSGDAGDLQDSVRVRARPELAACDDPPAGEASTSGIPLTFRPPLSPENDPSRFALVRVQGVPDSGHLSAGLADETGTWVLAARDLKDLHLHLAHMPPDAITLTATAVAIDDRDGTFTTVSQDLVLPSSALRTSDPGWPDDAATPPPASPRTVRSSALPLDLQKLLAELGGDSGLTALVVGGISGLAKLSRGTFDDETGSWILRPNEIDQLSLMPLADTERSFPLHLKVTAIRADPETGAPSARTLATTIGEPPKVADLPARHGRPGGVGFFRPIARRYAQEPT